MMIDNNFFLDTHTFLKKIASDIIIPNIGKLSENEVSTKEDNSKVTSYDVIIENELIEYFKKIGFSNIISEEGNSELLSSDIILENPIFLKYSISSFSIITSYVVTLELSSLVETSFSLSFPIFGIMMSVAIFFK